MITVADHQSLRAEVEALRDRFRAKLPTPSNLVTGTTVSGPSQSCNALHFRFLGHVRWIHGHRTWVVEAQTNSAQVQWRRIGFNALISKLEKA